MRRVKAYVVLLKMITIIVRSQVRLGRPCRPHCQRTEQEKSLTFFVELEYITEPKH